MIGKIHYEKYLFPLFSLCSTDHFERYICHTLPVLHKLHVRKLHSGYIYQGLNSSGYGRVIEKEEGTHFVLEGRREEQPCRILLHGGRRGATMGDTITSFPRDVNFSNLSTSFSN